MTVLEAVAIAGGFTYRAKESRMKIIRATDSTRQKNTVSPGTVVFPGDVIEIPERFF
jgi:polysaccharide export outer membrane protein